MYLYILISLRYLLHSRHCLPSFFYAQKAASTARQTALVPQRSLGVPLRHWAKIVPKRRSGGQLMAGVLHDGFVDGFVDGL